MASQCRIAVLGSGYVGLTVAAGADVLLVTTEWPAFSSVDHSVIGNLMTRRSIVDARNIINVEDAERAGFEYVGVGLGWPNSNVSGELSNSQPNKSSEFL